MELKHLQVFTHPSVLPARQGEWEPVSPARQGAPGLSVPPALPQLPWGLGVPWDRVALRAGGDFSFIWISVVVGDRSRRWRWPRGALKGLRENERK